MRAHAQSTNEYHVGEMSMIWLQTEICGLKLWTVDGSESVLRAWLHGKIFKFRVRGSSLRPLLTFLF